MMNQSYWNFVVASCNFVIWNFTVSGSGLKNRQIDQKATPLKFMNYLNFFPSVGVGGYNHFVRSSLTPTFSFSPTPLPSAPRGKFKVRPFSSLSSSSSSSSSSSTSQTGGPRRRKVIKRVKSHDLAVSSSTISPLPKLFLGNRPVDNQARFFISFSWHINVLRV